MFAPIKSTQQLLRATKWCKHFSKRIPGKQPANLQTLYQALLVINLTSLEAEKGFSA